MSKKTRKRGRKTQAPRENPTVTLSDWLKNNRLNVAFGTLFAVVLGIVAIGLFGPQPQAEVYPPTDIIGHVESYPQSRISERPIPINIQKHILEHVPLRGGERPGVLLQYNCVRYECAPDLVDRLAEIARAYEYVYLAPFPEMTPKIALTAFGDMVTLDTLDRERIIEFIETHQRRGGA